jgi:hypothetical protein
MVGCRKPLLWREHQKKKKREKEKQGRDGLLDIRLGSTGGRSRLVSEEGEDLLGMWLGSLDQGLPLLLVYPLCVTSFCPVDILLALGNQSYRAFNPNLQILLPKIQRKILFRNEVLVKVGEGLWLFLLWEEVGEEARKGGSHIDNSAAR